MVAERKRKLSGKVADFLRVAARAHLSQDEDNQEEAIQELSKWSILAFNADQEITEEPQVEDDSERDDSNVETLATYTGGSSAQNYYQNRAPVVMQEISTEE